jgi:predicted permease
MTIALASDRYSTYEQSAPFWRELSRRVDALPGVVRSGATDNLPLSSGFGCSGVITDAVGTPEERGNCMPMVTVTPGYFETMGIKVKGTLPTWSSVEAASGPLVVSAAFAKRFWHDENPIGHGVKPFNPQMPSFPVVAVAEDIRGNGLQKPVVEAIYFPIVPPPNSLGKGMMNSRYMYFVIRAPNANATTLVAAVRQIVKEMDPQVPIADVQPMELVVAKSVAQTSFTMMLLLIAAIIALSLSAVGVYGVIAYVVSQRRAEIGIRMALGAHLAEILRLIVGQSLVLAGMGAIVGVVASLAGTRLLGSLLFEVSPTDPLVLGGTALVLLLVALIASLGPTRQAARIQPVEAMRT